MNNTNMQSLHPGTSIRPILDVENVKKILTEYYCVTIKNIVELNGYDDKNYHITIEGNNDYNCREGYVLKIINVLDSAKPDLFDAQTQLLLHVGNRGILCPKPVVSKNGKYLETIKLKSGVHIIRLLEFISGTILNKVPAGPYLYCKVGELAAKLDKTMKSFSHPAYENHKTLWMLNSVTTLPLYIDAVSSDKRKKLIVDVIEEFEKLIIALPNTFKKGLIHGDLNEQNILVENVNGEWKIKAILDFGDTHIGYYVFEIAIAITYMILIAKNLDAGGYVLSGFMNNMSISEEEYSVLKICVAARLCQSLVLGAYSALLDPSNKYVLITAENGWDLLDQLWNVPEDDLLKRWKTTAKSFS